VSLRGRAFMWPTEHLSAKRSLCFTKTQFESVLKMNCEASGNRKKKTENPTLLAYVKN